MKSLTIIVLLVSIFLVKCTLYPATSSLFSLTGRYYIKENTVYYDWPCFRIAFCFESGDKVVWKVKDNWNIYEIVLNGNKTTKVQPGKSTSVTIFEESSPDSRCV